jgi:hypothetical protein
MKGTFPEKSYYNLNVNDTTDQITFKLGLVNKAIIVILKYEEKR